MVDVVSSSLPYLADKPTIKRTLEECKGDINAAVDKLLGAEDSGSQSSAHESSSVEREPDSDEEYQRGPSKKQIRKPPIRLRAKKRDSSQALSKLATHNDSQGSFASEDSQQSGSSSESGVNTKIKGEVKLEIKAESTDEKPSDALPRPKIRIKLKPPNPPPSSESTNTGGHTQQKQQAPQRQTAREKKDIKKQAQKAARKERQQAAIKAGDSESKGKTAITLRTKGVTNTPPIESGFRTLYI